MPEGTEDIDRMPQLHENRTKWKYLNGNGIAAEWGRHRRKK